MLKINVTERNGPRASKARLRDAATYAARETVEHWHSTYMLGHFTVEGGKRYGYQPRKGDNEPPRLPRTGKPGKYAKSTLSNPHYSWRKRREKGHNKPLVWSGRTKEMAKQRVRLYAKTNAAGTVTGTAAMDLPRYFYAYRKDLSQPDKANELTRTTPDEDVALQHHYRTKMLGRLVDTAPRGGTTRRRRVAG